MMSNAKHIGRIGALAVALGVGMATAVPAASAADEPPSDSTALIVCGTTCPKFDAANGEIVMNQFIKPIYQGRHFGQPIAVTTPNEAWPLTGVLRVLEFALGDSRLGGPGGPAWPDEPLWKLSGLFDLTGDQSIEAGAADLEAAMAAVAANPDDHMVVYGYSQGAVVVNKVREKLAAQYAGTEAPDIDFVLAGDVAVPNGGFGARFPGLHIPFLDWTYDGAELTDTPFDTSVITRQYDGFADFPLYPLNFVADLNAGLGLFYVHMYPFDVSLAPDPSSSPSTQSQHGNTTYYFFENPDLPLFGPLRTLGVPEPVIDVFEPFFKVIVEQGYDRSIPAWQPTPARLIPKLDPAKLATDLVDAIGEGIDNAGALAKPVASMKISATETNTDIDEDVHDVELQTNESVGAMESDGDGRTTATSPGDSNNSKPYIAGNARPTPLRDAVKSLSSGVKNVVAGVSDSIKTAISAGRHDANKSAGVDAGSQPQSATDD
jgi:hypothetical protein